MLYPSCLCAVCFFPTEPFHGRRQPYRECVQHQESHFRQGEVVSNSVCARQNCAATTRQHSCGITFRWVKDLTSRSEVVSYGMSPALAERSSITEPRGSDRTYMIAAVCLVSGWSIDIIPIVITISHKPIECMMTFRNNAGQRTSSDRHHVIFVRPVEIRRYL